jgi:Fur family peroxide stress response transcriptional regulator
MKIMQQLDDLVSSLREEGFRITPQRVAILDYLLETDDHPSAEYIHKIIQKKYPMVSLSTVYKTLDLLREKKLVNEIEVDGESRFDADTDAHINLVCMNCGKIDDVKYLILKGSFELFGYCTNCKSKFN